MTREDVERILDDVQGKRVLLLAHHNADPDALCSSILLAEGLKAKGAVPRIGVVESASKLAQKVLENLQITVEKNPSMEDTDLLILLDTSTTGQLSEYASKFEASTLPKVRIDHHVPQEDAIPVTAAWVDGDARSTIELVLALLETWNVPLSKPLTRATLFGLLVETAHFKHASVHTFELIAKLLKAHDIPFQEILSWARTPIDISEKIARFKAARHVHFYRLGDALFASSRAGSFEASVARTLMHMGADVSMVSNTTKKEVRVSLRANNGFLKRNNLDLGRDLIPSIAKVLGGTGSGHPAAAGANGPNLKALPDAEKKALKLLEEKLGVNADEL